MPTIDVVVESGRDLSTRARQVCGMFDCPAEEKQRLSWAFAAPIEDRDWSIGLIVGPSGSGKSTVAKHLWPDEIATVPTWDERSIIDNFPASMSVADIASTLGSVGFSTIPAWLRPYSVLSNGERFRADIARRIADNRSLVVVDEFTSVVDRQVAAVACNSVQKAIRRNGRKLVAVTCHSDVSEWLQPDWVIEPATRTFRWREVQRRPKIHIEMGRVPYEAWSIFAKYHYMSAELNKSARCYGLWANGTLAAFCGVLHMPHATVKNLKVVSRVVTLPDWQGLGLAFVLLDALGSCHKAAGYRFRNYPAHPAFIHAHKKPKWLCVKSPGAFGQRKSKKSGITGMDVGSTRGQCAVFEYVGPAATREQASNLLGANV